MSPSDAYEGFSRVRPAQQDRSRKAQRDAIDSFDALLRDRPLSRVAMQDVADRAGLSITSVYARFDGKDALLLALHEKVMAERLMELDRLATAEAEADRPTPIREFVSALIAGAVELAHEDAHIIRAVLASGDDETNGRAAAFVRSSSERVADMLVPRLPGPPDDTDRDVDFAWRGIIAMVQHAGALGDADPARHPLERAELVQRLADQFLANIGVVD